MSPGLHPGGGSQAPDSVVHTCPDEHSDVATHEPPAVASGSADGCGSEAGIDDACRTGATAGADAGVEVWGRRVSTLEQAIARSAKTMQLTLLMIGILEEAPDRDNRRETAAVDVSSVVSAAPSG